VTRAAVSRSRSRCAPAGGSSCGLRGDSFFSRRPSSSRRAWSLHCGLVLAFANCPRRAHAQIRAMLRWIEGRAAWLLSDQSIIAQWGVTRAWGTRVQPGPGTCEESAVQKRETWCSVASTVQTAVTTRDQDKHHDRRDRNENPSSHTIVATRQRSAYRRKRPSQTATMAVTATLWRAIQAIASPAACAGNTLRNHIIQL
jgi:hypothetical protein